MFRSAKVRYCAVLYVKQRRSTVLFSKGKVRHSSSKRGLDLQCIAMAVVGKDLRGHCIAESRRGMDGQCQAEEWQSLAGFSKGMAEWFSVLRGHGLAM